MDLTEFNELEAELSPETLTTDTFDGARVARGIVEACALAIVDPWCFVALAVLGVVSGLDYVVRWGSKAYRAGKRKKQHKHARGAFRRPDA